MGGPPVQAELARVCPGRDASCPATYAWLGRLDQLRRQLEICRGPPPA